MLGAMENELLVIIGRAFKNSAKNAVARIGDRICKILSYVIVSPRTPQKIHGATSISLD